MKVLVVVDMQNDFVTGSLGSEAAGKIVAPLAEKIRSYQAEGNQVWFTLDTHGEDYLQTQEGGKLPVMHCIRKTPGWEIAAEIRAAFEGEPVVFEKNTFGSVALGEALCRLNPKEVELVGLCTDICVISNALLVKAFLPQIPVKVDASCCAGVTPESHRNALAAMKACQIEIIGEETV